MAQKVFASDDDDDNDDDGCLSYSENIFKILQVHKY
jgi:hypothetical protein